MHMKLAKKVVTDCSQKKNTPDSREVECCKKSSKSSKIYTNYRAMCHFDHLKHKNKQSSIHLEKVKDFVNNVISILKSYDYLLLDWWVQWCFDYL